MTKHRQLIINECRADIINILVGNKSDIKLKKLDKKYGRELGMKTGFVKYIEISAKDGTNTTKVMETVLSEAEKICLYNPSDGSWSTQAQFP